MNSPLDTAYNRLDETHRAWHGALSGYHRIEDFRSNINMGIQALRNLTFALQKQKDKFLDFENWYATWVAKMAHDNILRELSSARTTVVHQQDLKLYSIGTAKIKGWVDFEKVVFHFDPMKDSYSVAKSLYTKNIKNSSNPSGFRQGLVFEFERKWVYEKLPDHELLEALSYAYHFFFEMLLDASKRFMLNTKESYITGNFCSCELNSKNRMKCMAITSNERCLKYSFDSGSTLKLVKVSESKFFPSKTDLEMLEDVQVYNFKSKEIAHLLSDLIPDEYPFDLMKLSTERAINIFRMNKSLTPTFHLFFPNEKKVLALSDPSTSNDQQYRHLFIDTVADEVIKNNIDFVISVGIVGIYEVLDNKPIVVSLENNKNSENMIQVTYMSAQKGKIVLIPFRKNYLGKIIFSKPSVTDFGIDNDIESMYYYMFNPIIDALRKVAE